ncbi:MAG: hypothetical protein ISS19_07130 [Bacteroidales bacterium]|nr:hypothetical protein [Bacteroidales bacterium]
MKTAQTRSFLLITSSLLLVIFFALSGCKNKKSQSSGLENDLIIDETGTQEQVLREITDYPLPTAFEVTKLLIDAGAGYILDLCNRTENIDTYINLKSKALNLGVYGADLSYAATYNQTQETMQYLEATSRLINDLQISTGFNQSLVTRVEDNLDNVDSLILIITESFISTYEYLIENEQDNISVLVLAGSWIEALYITTQITIISINNEKIVDIISDQDKTLEKLIEIMEPLKDDPMIQDIHKSLKELKTHFDKEDKTFTKEQLDALIEKTESVRNKIV